MITKTEITNALNNLRKHGFIVYHFNSHKAMPTGLKGLPDHLVIGKMYLYWIEVKLGTDTLKPDQIIFKKMIEQFEKRNKVVKYRMVTDKDSLESVITEIYGK